MGSSFSKLLDLVFPRSREVTAVEKLAEALRLHELPPASESPEPWIHPLFQYQDPRVRALVWEIKYRANPLLISSVSRLLSELFLGFIGENKGLVAENWVLIPVPSSKLRLKEHGFSQTRKLAEAMVKHDAHHLFTYAPHAVRKVRETPPQTTLKDRRKRLANLADAFSVPRPDDVRGKSVVIVDDVATTGSTLREIRKTLYVAGVKEVIALTIAH